MTTYPSKVDWWLGLCLMLPPAGGILAIVLGVTGHQPSSVYIGVGALVFYGAILGGLVLPMRYTIGADGLGVRSGLMKLHVPWDRLRKVELSSNPLSSPALSLRRLNVEYTRPNGKETWVLISPVDRERFLADLAAASPAHRLDGTTLTRR